MTDQELAPILIITTTTLRMTMTNMVRYLRRGGAALPEHGRVRLEYVIDNDDIGDQEITMCWTEEVK